MFRGFFNLLLRPPCFVPREHWHDSSPIGSVLIIISPSFITMCTPVPGASVPAGDVIFQLVRLLSYYGFIINVLGLL